MDIPSSVNSSVNPEATNHNSLSTPANNNTAPRKALPFHRAAQLALALLGATGVQNSNAQTPGAALGSLKLQNTEVELRTFGEKLPGNATLENNITSLKDGLTPDEERKLREDMAKVLSHPQYGPLAKRVLNALDEKGPSVIETGEEKKARLEREKMDKTTDKVIEGINTSFFNKTGWKIDPTQEADAEISVKKGEVLSRFGKTKKSGNVAQATSAIIYEATITEGQYMLDVTMAGKGKLAAWYYTTTGDKIGPRIFIAPGKSLLTVPPGTGVVKFGMINSATEPEFSVTNFTLSRATAESIAMVQPEQKDGK